jgi:starch synthase (maltosyl-transferring)
MPPLPQHFTTVQVEKITPVINGGRFPLKRVPGEELVVEADIYKDGHDVLSAVLKWRKVGAAVWNETRMRPLDNKRWRGSCVFYENAMHEYTIEAWPENFLTWRIEYQKKHQGGVQELHSEKLEGAGFIERAAKRAHFQEDKERLMEFARQIRELENDAVHKLVDEPTLSSLVTAWPNRSLSTVYKPYLRVFVDRPTACLGAWYEFFPRSAGGHADRGSTFRECVERVDDAKRMGFDVIYFPPIHPIGETNRKGPNNSVTSQPGDPGVPYAIGNYRQGVNGGGHKDVDPNLGTLEDFEWLVSEIRKRGMEVALDFAINCSPDHPYVREHPDWFYYRPDGTLKYAENPPKKYEDVHPLNFNSKDWQGIWEEMRDLFLFWAERGVRIFRVDNPHTKPVAFWEWLIAEIRETYPDVIFLSEAFTHPKMMKMLAKVGYSQSYTYFTWRNTKWELTDYLTELTQSHMAEYYRGNLFTNTPDILPTFLQTGGRPAHMIRAVLAATCSPIYGIYSGFELCENTPVRQGKEEYLNSEKYQYVARDWNAPGNIKPLISRLNQIRHEHRALQQYRNLRFLETNNENIICYSKITQAQDDILIIVINLDPHTRHDAMIEIPVTEVGLNPWESYQAHDLLTDEKWTWQGERNYVVLDPTQENPRVAHVFAIRRFLRGLPSGEMDFA